MKTSRLIYIFTGWSCIITNCIGYLAVVGLPQPYFRNKSVPHIIGFNFWFVAGFMLLFFASRMKKKIKKSIKEDEFDFF